MLAWMIWTVMKREKKGTEEVYDVGFMYSRGRRFLDDKFDNFMIRLL